MNDKISFITTHNYNSRLKLFNRVLLAFPNYNLNNSAWLALYLLSDNLISNILYLLIRYILNVNLRHTIIHN